MSSTTGHTPGPWSVYDRCFREGGGLDIVASGSGNKTCSGVPFICTMSSGAYRSMEEQLANARLIAAAPLMQDRLECLLAYLQACRTMIREGRDPIPDVSDLDAEISTTKELLDQGGAA